MSSFASLTAELEKLNSTDSDLRLMALSDLAKELNARSAVVTTSSSSRRSEGPHIGDAAGEAKLVKKILDTLLEDPNSEVKNMAVSVVAALTKRCRPESFRTIVHTLTSNVAGGSEETKEVACLTLKSVVLDMPVGPGVTPEVEHINEKCLSAMSSASTETQIAAQLCQILSDLYARAAGIVRSSPKVEDATRKSFIPLLFDGPLAVRKRAIATFAVLVAIKPALFDDELKNGIMAGLRQGGDSARSCTQLISALAKTPISGKIGAFLQDDDSVVIKLLIKQTEDPSDVETAEGALLALEILVLRCPSDIPRFVMPVAHKALVLLKYDPNYVELDDDDEDMDEGNDDGDDEYDDDPYSDDEDDSWKLRRAAAKLLFALIGTRNEYLADFYAQAAPTLIARFGEREESVRLEVLAAFENLLRQTAIAKTAELASGSRNKRKRSEGMDEDSLPEASIVALLRSYLPSLLKAVLKQLSSKSISSRQKCFSVLRLVTEILEGGLDTAADDICDATANALRTIENASSSLAVSALSFLATFFAHHSTRVYSSRLPSLVPAIIRCMKNKLRGVSFEAFSAASALAQSVRAKGSSSPLANGLAQPVQQVFKATTDVLADTSIDGDVRERALDTLGNLLVHEGDSLRSDFPSCLPLISARLNNEVTAGTALTVIAKIANAPTCRGDDIDTWLLEVLPQVVVALRRSRKSAGRTIEFTCLSNILNRLGNQLSVATANDIVIQLKPIIDTPSAIHVIGNVLDNQPSCRDSVNDLLPQILDVVRTPTINTALSEALLIFFAAYVDGDVDCATRLVPRLVENIGSSAELPDATSGGTSAYLTTAKCIGAVVHHSQRNAAGVIALFQRTIKSSKGTEAQVYLALLSIGEIGRVVDLSQNVDLFEQSLSFFSNPSEEVRSAAAFAAGNMAVGSSKTFLPLIVRHIDTATKEANRILLLHALKEVVLHSSPAHLEAIAESLWKPLFADSEQSQSQTPSSVDDAGDDGIRNVKAACIGKLTTAAPSKFLPQLQSLLKSSPQNRAIVAAAIRYSFIDTTSSYDELIAPIIVDFLSLMHDENLVVRRLSLASLNAAIQNKPHLIIDRLAALQPLLFEETVVKKELQRTVMMGPFAVIEDKGLENRKTAYETMYTMLNTCFSKVDIGPFTDRVLAALTDVNEIKVLGLMLLLRLGQLSPTTVVPRLDDAVDAFKEIMKDVQVKEDTVKQDLERKEEMQRSALRTAVPLYRLSSQQQAPAFHAFVSGLLGMQQWKEFRDYQA